MMSNTWKISVFGILALMLAFGLAVTDAEAQLLANPSTVTVGVTSQVETSDAPLRASQPGRIISFAVILTDGTTDNPFQEGMIEIQVPGGEGWSSPRRVTGTNATTDLADAPAGSVTFAPGSTAIAEGNISVGSRRLRVTVPAAASGETITWHYKTDIPVKARNSNFRIISKVHKGLGPHLAVDEPSGTAPDLTYSNDAFTGVDGLIDDKAIYEARGNHVVIKVGSAPDGSGTFVLSGPSIPKGAANYKSDDAPTYDHSNKYFVTAEKEDNLVFIYTAAGTMHKGSVIRFDIPNDTAITTEGEDWPLLKEGSGVGRLTVSGATLYSFDEVSGSQRRTAAAFLLTRVEKGHPVRFTYMAKTPKVTDASDDDYAFSARAVSLEEAHNDVSLAEANQPQITFGTDGTDTVGAGVTFVVVQGQGGGTLTIDATGDNHGTNIPASTDGSDAENLVLTFAAAGRMLQGSQVTVAVPDGWTPAPRTSRVTGSTQDGIVTVTEGTVTDGDFAATVEKVENRLITIMLTGGNLVAGDTVNITYSGVKQPSDGGISTFTASSNSYKGEALKALAADQSINVVVGNGSGSIALMKDGQPFKRTTRNVGIPVLQFVYTPAGHLRVATQLQIEIPAGWTPPVQDNKDGTVDAGELSIAPSDKVTLALPSGRTITATTTKVLTPSDSVTITYRKVTVPDVDPRSDVFNTRVDTDADGTVAIDGTLVSPSPTVGIGQAPDGAGIMTVNVTQASAGENLDEVVFTYVAVDNMAFGAEVQLKIDPDWTAAIDGSDPANSGKEGTTTLSGDGDPELTISDEGYTLTAELFTAISSGASLAFTYKNITAPSVAGSHEFGASSKHTSTGILTALDDSPEINVSVRAAGSVVLATTEGPLPSIQPGDALGNLQFIFSAGARMEIGSEVEIVIPAGWTRASEDNGDAVVIPGEVALDATDPATLEVVANADGSYTVTATTTGVLLVDEMLTFTYQEVDAPADEGPYNFASRMSIAAGGTPLPIDDSPRVVVRTAPTTLTLTASANSFFLNESITLTVALDARAPIGGLNVALTTDPADAGTFSMTEGGDARSTVRIADSADSMSAMVYYTNAMAGAVTVKATSGELSDSAVVTAKPTISDLQVNDETGMMDESGMTQPVEVDAGGTLTVTVVGQEGGGKVKLTEMDTDADGVVTHRPVVPTKSLDPDPDAVDVPEGSHAYTEVLDLSALKVGDYTVRVTIAGEDAELAIRIVIPRDPVTAITVTASADSFFAGDSIQVTVESDVRAPEGGLEVTLSTVPADSGTFSMTEGGEAIPTVTIPDAEDSMSAMVYYTNSTAGAVTLTATAGELDPASADVTVNDLVSSFQVNGTDAPDAIAGNETISVSAIGKDGTATVRITDADGKAVVSGVGLDKDADADVPEGSASYSRDIDLPDLADGDYTVTVTITGGTKSIALEVMAPRDPVTELTLTASADSFFVGGSIQVTVASDVRTPVGGLEVTLLTDPADSGMFSIAEGGEAVPTVTILDAEDSMSAMVYYTSSTAGDVTLTAAAGELSADAEVSVKSTISNLQVNDMDEPDPVPGGASISVTATGKDGRSSVEVTDAEGQSVVSGLGLDGVEDDEGNVAYSRDIVLPSLEDGSYTVTVTIGSSKASIEFEVLNDQTAPMLSEARARPVQAAYAVNGKEVVLSVNVARNTSDIAIDSVTADVSALDSTLTGDDAAVKLAELPSGSGTYTSILTVSADNMHGDGPKMITFMATDRVGNESDPAAAMVTLKNDQTAPTLTMASAKPSPAANGTNVYISVSSESGLTTVTADASAIGGGMVTLSEPMMTANGNGNGMDANGMTNGMDANGMTNGMDANGNGANGMDANGNGANGMDANGNVMYTGMATVTDAADGEQMITISATDGSGNSSTASASVMIDNTGPALTMANADPAMATNGTVVTISVSTESGATVMADASAIGGDAAVPLTESADTAGMYSSAPVTVASAMDGPQMITISATDALGNPGTGDPVTVTVDNTAPALTDAAITPDWALNGDTVTISFNGGESGLTVTADASAIAGDAALVWVEGMDADMAGTGMYSADVTVTGAMGGAQMVSISASDAIGNASEAVSASVSIHVVTSASFSPADVSTGDTVTVSAMGTAGLTATFNVFDAEGTNIVTEGMLTQSADTPGSYSGGFDVVVDAHPTGEYWVSVTIGQASLTANDGGALTIDHLAQFDLMIGAGTHLIHVPLDVTHIDGMPGTIDTVGDLYAALGDAVNFIISLDADGRVQSYLDGSSAGSVADAAIGDDTGLIAVMSSAATLKLAGNALGTGGVSTISLSAGSNWVGVPLDGDLLSMISDALSPLVSAVVVSNEAGNGFDTITQAGDRGDGAIMGGVGYIVVAAATASIPVVGVAWDNSGMMDAMADSGMTAANGASTAPSIGFQTPVLYVQGKLIDEVGMMSLEGLNVSVKNLSSGAVLGHTTATDDYSMTFVKLDSSAAKVGDVLEIKADSPNPLLGIRPVQHVVTAEDVLDSRISLPDLVTYEIPALTELLANYPNPFNPETWIPFRLAEDASVSLTIYGASGSLVRTIDIGFAPAAVYQARSEAIYWDGRNDFGEQVSSGIYFYHLNAGDFSATRKMVIVK